MGVQAGRNDSPRGQIHQHNTVISSSPAPAGDSQQKCNPKVQLAAASAGTANNGKTAGLRAGKQLGSGQLLVGRLVKK